MPLLEVDPDSVQAGVIPLLIVIGALIVIALGYLSMRRHIGRIKAPTKAELAARSHEPSADSAAAEAGTDAEPSAAEPPLPGSAP